MKTDITAALVEEHRLIVRMLDLVEERARSLEADKTPDYGFFLDAVDFVRNYADRFHHAKEEDVLFEALIGNGMPREHSPVAAMLLEHEEGRGYVRGMEQGATAALLGAAEGKTAVALNALGYVGMLREHIEKEDQVLYPLAERVLPEAGREAILAAYAAAEEKAPAGFHEKYLGMVERYEGEGLRKAS